MPQKFFTKDKKVRPIFFGKTKGTMPHQQTASKVLPKKSSMFGEKASNYGRRSVGFVKKRVQKHNEKKIMKEHDKIQKKESALKEILNENPTWGKEQAEQEMRKDTKKTKKFNFGNGKGGDFEEPMRAGEVKGGEYIGDPIEIDSIERVVGREQESNRAFTNLDNSIEDNEKFWKESKRRDKKSKHEQKVREQADAKSDRVEMMLIGTASGREALGITL